MFDSREALWAVYRSRPSQDSQGAVVDAYMADINKIVNVFLDRNRLPTGSDRTDLWAAAFQAVWKHVPKWKGTAEDFPKGFHWPARNALMTLVRTLDGGGKGKNREAIKTLRVGAGGETPLPEPVSQDDHETDVDQREFRDAVLESLQGKPLAVMKCLFQRGMSAADTARELGLSRERVRQISQRTIRKLRQKMVANRASPQGSIKATAGHRFLQLLRAHRELGVSQQHVDGYDIQDLVDYLKARGFTIRKVPAQNQATRYYLVEP